MIFIKQEWQIDIMKPKKDISILLGKDYVVNDAITIKQPTIGDILEIGEEQYFQTVFTLTCIPSDMKYRLYKMGLDYEKVEDYELFFLFSPTIDSSISKRLFYGVDLSNFEMGKDMNNDSLILMDEENDIVIDKFAYIKIAGFFRSLHGLTPKVEHAGNEETKKILIEEEKMKIEMNKDKEFDSTLYSLILSMVNTEEFKYDFSSIQNLNIAAFLASVTQIQKKKSALALLQGCYSGMIDTSKIKQDNLQWIG